MQIVSSYGVEIKQKNIPLCSTLDIFRKAVSYLIPVYAETWKELSEIRNLQKRFNEAEHLVHETKKNHARFSSARSDNGFSYSWPDLGARLALYAENHDEKYNALQAVQLHP